MRAITVTESTEKFTMDAMRQLQPQVLIPAQVPISDQKENPRMKTHLKTKATSAHGIIKGSNALRSLN